MKRMIVVVLASILVTGCVSPGGERTVEGGGGAPVQKKRLAASVFSDPAGFHRELTNPGGTTGSVPGLAELWQMMNASLAYSDDNDVYQPLLAEAVPTVENGNWRVFSDGRMETTWRLKPGIFWHDGTAFTSQDLVFSAEVNRDKDIGAVIPAALELVETVEAPDPLTVLVKWKTPFIEADTMFTPGLVVPFPKHILQSPFNDDKATFLNHAYWREGFIGTGAYRLGEWVPGSHMILQAYDRYFEGRPRIDEIEVKFIGDFQVVLANLLAETVDKHIGRGFGVEQAIQLRDTAQHQKVLMGEGLMGGVAPIFPQFINPDPPIVFNLEFRRALLMAIDRQEMNDTINYGFGQVAHSWLQPDRAEYRGVEQRIVRYDYDPRRAAQMIENLGYTKGSDGIYRDAGGQRLRFELSTTDQLLIQPRSAFSVGDYWKRFGMDVETINVPNQLIPDREYRSQFPGFHLVLSGHNVRSATIRQYHSINTPLPGNRFQGGNRARYQNPAFDALIDRYVTTIPITQRIAVLGDILNHQTDQLTMMTLFYQGSFTILGHSKLKGVTGSKVWNAHLWDL